MKELEFEQGLPNAVDVERLALGSAIMDSVNNLPVVMALCREDCFSTSQHQVVFRTLCEMSAAEKAIDRITVLRELHEQGKLDLAGGPAKVVDLDTGLPEIYSLDAYCEILAEKAALRRLITSMYRHTQILLGRGAGVAEIAAAKAAIADLDTETNRRKQGFQNMAELIRNEAGGGPRAYLVPTPESIGIPWPWLKMTDAIGGMRAGQVICVSAGTGVGKTTFGCAAIAHAAAQGHCTAILTTEMSSQEQTIKIMCQRAGVNLHRWMEGKATRQDQDAVAAVVHTHLPSRIYVDEREQVTPAMMDAALTALKHDPPAVVMVDYFQLMESGLRTGDVNREQHLAHVSRQMKRLARKHKTCFLVLSQVNDSGSTRESKALENDATVIILLERQEGGAMKVKFRKSRFSARSDMYLGFDGATGLFFEADNT
ncbi:DnaB-like helicase C-terminal domain-containing protein [Pseudomonas sp.]|uniref:replicative DNA helicase n=1 Tax=Pseudomonas sp. TaxID=306 RepID=UPI00333FD29E